MYPRIIRVALSHLRWVSAKYLKKMPTTLAAEADRRIVITQFSAAT